jgi:MOSC domain-containing protein YiiM
MTTAIVHRTQQELEQGLETIRQSPKNHGRLEMIVRRPVVGAREVLDEGELDVAEGLVGDSWSRRGSHKSADKTQPHPEMQLNIMSARVLTLIAGDRSRWSLAGDQLLVDLDLSGDNLPAGTRLSIGGAIIEITPMPHTGCGKFVQRFGVDAQTFVNSTIGRQLNLRGLNARVVQSGPIRAGDAIVKL